LKDDVKIDGHIFGVLIIDSLFADEYENPLLPVAFLGHPKGYRYPHYILDEDIDFFQLKALMDIIMNGGTLVNFSSACRLKEFSSSYIIKNDIFSIDKIVFNITKDLVGFFKLSDLQKIRIGLSEIITNAIEHVNLEITGDEKFKATESDSYYTLLEERLKNERYSKRVVKVDIRLKRSFLKIKIKDSGKGFDTSKIKLNYSEEDLFKLHGRGIMIAKMYFDDILYNRKGNEVTLVKRII
ncbi:MAG: ATP-binding protein, partial [Deferribacterales bacterium]